LRLAGFAAANPVSRPLPCQPLHDAHASLRITGRPPWPGLAFKLIAEVEKPGAGFAMLGKLNRF